MSARILTATIAFVFIFPLPCRASTDSVACVEPWESVPLLRGKDLDSAIVRALECDESITLLSYEGGWAIVRTREGKQGYVMRQFVDSQLVNWIKGNFRPQITPVLQEIETNLRLPQRLKPLPNLRLPAPRNAPLARHGEGFLLDKVSPDLSSDIQRRLERIEDQSLFDCEPYKSRHALSAFSCKYLARIDTRLRPISYRPPPDSLLESLERALALAGQPMPIALPESWATVLAGQAVKSIWVLCQGHANATGVPEPSEQPFIIPVALQTDSDRYLVMNEHEAFWAPVSAAANQTNHLLSLPGCQERAPCVNHANQILHQEIKLSFSGLPLMASPYDQNAEFPRDLRMGRQYEKSFVLGEPFCEFSVYIFRTFPSSQVIYSMIDILVLTSPNIAGTYAEPTDQQLAKYKSAVQSSIATAVERTCAKLGGLMRDGVCEVDHANF